MYTCLNKVDVASTMKRKRETGRQSEDNKVVYDFKISLAAMNSTVYYPKLEEHFWGKD